MPALSVGELARATGGELVRGNPDTMVSTFAIDTRKLASGGMFFALKGSRTDGHDHLEGAARRGAAAAVIEREPPGEEAPQALIRVNDVAAALGRCGALARTKQKDLQVIGITGSAGKTMTKELLAAGLAAERKVHRSPGNWNNHLGLPLSLLACPDEAQVAVLEMGMSGHGEIAALADIAAPDVGLVTNVRPVHLEFFKDLDDIAAAKGELFAKLGPEAVSVVNLDDEQLRVQSQRHAGPRVTFGRDSSADVRLERIDDRFSPGASLTFRHDKRERVLKLKIGSAHAAWNALAAVAGVVAAGGDVDHAVEAMAQVEPGPGRGKLHFLADGIVVIDDSYNSNPAALATVLHTLGRGNPAGRKVLVMGDMLELGERAQALHRDAGKQVAAAGVQLLFAVGRLAHVAAEAARRAGVPEIHQHQDASSAARELPECLKPGDLVIVKGSRGVRLEKVVEAVCKDRGEGG